MFLVLESQRTNLCRDYAMDKAIRVWVLVVIDKGLLFWGYENVYYMLDMYRIRRKVGLLVLPRILYYYNYIIILYIIITFTDTFMLNILFSVYYILSIYSYHITWLISIGTNGEYVFEIVVIMSLLKLELS